MGVWSAHWAELLETPEIKIMENQHPVGSDIKPRPLCHQLRRFTPTASKGSEHFLPSGWKTSLHLTGASSTGIDLLSACIWDHMAHMPGRDTVTRLSHFLFTTWLRCKASLQWEHGPCNGIKKIIKAKFVHIWTLNRVKGRHPIYRGHNSICRKVLNEPVHIPRPEYSSLQK